MILDLDMQLETDIKQGQQCEKGQGQDKTRREGAEACVAV